MKINSEITLVNDGLDNPISDKWKQLVSQMKNKYGFDKGFNLEKKLIDTKRTFDCLMALYKSISTPKEIKFKSEKIISSMTETLTELSNAPEEIKAYLHRIINLPHTIESDTKPECGFNLNKYINDTNLIISAISSLLEKTPKIKSGPQPRASNKDIIRILLTIYQNGTNKIVLPLKKNGRKQIYLDQNNKNEIVEFILDVEPLLVRIGSKFRGDSLGEESTISETINELLKEKCDF